MRNTIREKIVGWEEEGRRGIARRRVEGGGEEEVQRERESWVEFQGAAAVKATPEARRRRQRDLGNREIVLECCSQ